MRNHVVRSALIGLGLVIVSACGTGATQGAAPASSPSATSSPTPNYPAGFTVFGFPNVTASANYSPGQALTLTHGSITVQVPAAAFDKPLVFQLLEGQTSYWQKFAPQGQKVISAFAFRSVDPSTNELVQKYNAPVVFVLDDPAVTDMSIYSNTTPSDPPKVFANPVPATIQGHVLKHGNIGSPVGWVVTSPQT